MVPLAPEKGRQSIGKEGNGCRAPQRNEALLIPHQCTARRFRCPGTAVALRIPPALGWAGPQMMVGESEIPWHRPRSDVQARAWLGWRMLA
eukprot:scaffold25_cov342-Pavlova_lutheri.AAC.36